MSDKLKVVAFSRPEEREVANLPTRELMIETLNGEEPTKVITIVACPGELGYYLDGVTYHEALGLMEDVKFSILQEPQ